MTDSFQTLIRRWKQGDPTAFDQLYERTHKVVFYAVLGILHDKAAAEDILQDTYMRFLERIEQYQEGRLLSYLVTMAKNLAINEYHKRARTIHANESLDYLPSFDAVRRSGNARARTASLIERALAVLTPTERSVVVLYTIAQPRPPRNRRRSWQSRSAR
ncbi:MAG: sigma-70 family RNA polymerase sigma factor [Bacillus subtilis]|nr:sigma-70 family RNA polymerase sigma factor [Bacillus subtilis]